jgi:hypothetical protein
MWTGPAGTHVWGSTRCVDLILCKRVRASACVILIVLWPTGKLSLDRALVVSQPQGCPGGAQAAPMRLSVRTFRDEHDTSSHQARHEAQLIAGCHLLPDPALLTQRGAAPACERLAAQLGALPAKGMDVGGGDGRWSMVHHVWGSAVARGLRGIWRSPC